MAKRRPKRGRPKGQTKAQIIEEVKKTKRALELQIRGFSYSAISDQMEAEGFTGIGKTRVFQLVKSALEEAVADQKEAANRLVSLEMLRLDDMTKGLYVAARKGETPAVNAMLNVMDRRARYAGIDAPTKTETALHGKAGAPPISTQAIDDAARSFQHKLLKTLASWEEEERGRGIPEQPVDGGEGEGSV
jgi:hypothetical protein